MPLERCDRACRFITDEMFDEKIIDLMDRADSFEILKIPGVKELVDKHYEAKALQELVDDREFFDDDEEEEDVGAEA